jgi:hypothetical protein
MEETEVNGFFDQASSTSVPEGFLTYAPVKK